MTNSQAAPKRYARTYFGQVWYDQQGQAIAQTGHENRVEAERRIKSVNDSTRGKWCFALVQTMGQETGKPEVWENAVLFPDGKSRKLRPGELPVDPSRPQARGVWITLDAAKKVCDRVRAAPTTRFPWELGVLECRQQRFANMVEFEKWCEQVTTTLFICDLSHTEPPVEEGLYAYVAITPR